MIADMKLFFFLGRGGGGEWGVNGEKRDFFSLHRDRNLDSIDFFFRLLLES